MRVTTLSLAATAALAALAAGCGSSSSGSSSSGFVQKADAACAKARADSVPGNQQLPFAKTAQTAAAAQEIFVRTDKTELATFSALKAPSDKRSTFDAWVAKGKAMTNLDEQELAAMRANNRARSRALQQQAQGVANAAKPLAQKLGLRACADQLPPSDVAAIRKVVTATTETNDPSICAKDFDAHYLKVAFQPGGTVKSCEAQQKSSKPATSATVTAIHGAGTVGFATVKAVGGTANGQTADMMLVKQGANGVLDTPVVHK